jgi:alcohol dehydrogenase class IV
MFGGLCLANAGLGAVHGFAAPVGGMFAAPHGGVCAALLAPVLRANLGALRARAPDAAVLGRFTELGALLTGRADATVEDGLGFVAELTRALGVPGLGGYGVTRADVPALVAKARVASSMKGNPIVLNDDELAEIAAGAL